MVSLDKAGEIEVIDRFSGQVIGSAYQSITTTGHVIATINMKGQGPELLKKGFKFGMPLEEGNDGY